MLTISQINTFNFNQYPRINKKKNTLSGLTSFNPKYNKDLDSDTICFKGAPNLLTEGLREMVISSSKRLEPRFNFTENGINEIIANVTLKNLPFLQDLLNLNNKKLPAKAICILLNYINKSTTNVEEFREKIETLKDLKNVVNGRGFTKSVLSEYLDEISSQGIIDILKSDILLENTKHDFNTLQYAYNYAVTFFNNSKKTGDNAPTMGFQVSKFMNEGIFSSILALAMVYDKSTLNELFYNRGKYIKTIYMPRFRTLEESDLANLRSVQVQAVTDKENKGDNYATYEISLDDKIWVMNFLHANREIINDGFEGLDFNKYKVPSNSKIPDGNFIIKFQDMKIDLLDKVLRRIGVKGSVVDKYMEDWRKAYEEDQSLTNHRKDFWDINYAHLLNAPKDSLLRKIVLSDTYGNFEYMIYEKGQLADINRLNRQDFINNNLDPDKFLHPDVKPITRKFIDNSGRKTRTFTVRNWDRCPKESLLDGNYTTCCTGLDKDQGESFLHYMTNTCTTTLEIRNEKNKVIGMSRILMAKINGQVAMVVENIEVNNKMVKHYLYDDATKYKFREMIFDYARAFAKDINKSDKEIPVYFSSKYYKVKDIEKGLEAGKKYIDVELIGEFPDQIYINAYGGRLDRSKLQFVDDGDEFALYLSNITQKAKPIIEIDNTPISDSNYNYADTSVF